MKRMMRHSLILAAASLALAGCADMSRPPAMAEPAPLRSNVTEQNRFVPPPGGFAGASAAAAASGAPMQAPMETPMQAPMQAPFQAPMQAPMGDMAASGPMPGFVPIDDNGFTAETQGDFIPGTSAADAARSTGPNVVEYALRTTHPVGTPRYRRSNPLRWQTWERNCMRFATQDAAQEAFLAAGGPERDRQNLDPDGDGYACWWNPEPFRRAMRAGE
jgi:hypothetical protein